MNFFILGVLCFFSVIGVVEVVRKFNFWIYKPRKTKFYMGVVINDIETVENTVKSLVERLKWLDLGTEIEVFIIDKTDNSNTMKIIKNIIKKFPNVSLL